MRSRFSDTIKSFIPQMVLEHYQRWKYQRRKSAFIGLSNQQIFNQIYESARWGEGESCSGPGSSHAMTIDIVHGLERLIRQYDIERILDVPCGDFHWMSRLDLEERSYLGGDIVEALILKNRKAFGAANRRFEVLDLLHDSFPEADLILIRDAFVHFSFSDIKAALDNIKRADIKYLLMTSFTGQNLNFDITTGDWRPLNFIKAPFHFPPPIETIEEGVSNGFASHSKGKSLLMWRLEEIPLVQ